MRRDPDFFGDQDLDLIYIAKKLKEALKLESQLTEAGFDYLVETDTYRGGIVFQSERVGVFFYVHPDRADEAREALQRLGYRVYDNK